MDAALGPPAQLAADPDDLTPMLSQYFELCEEYDDSLLLFQVGDFYETFCEAAEVVARLLEITLTKREDSTGSYPMAGIPIDNAESYVETLLDAGYRVAIADQVQDPDEATGVVDRAVTRILTPGTLTEDELLETDANNFVACLAGQGEYGVAFLDVSTGDFYATGTDSRSAVADEISRFAPAEAILDPDLGLEDPADLFPADCMVTPYRPGVFERDHARETVESYFGPPGRLLVGESEVQACGALLSYAEYTRGGRGEHLDYLNHLTRYDPREYMLLDAVALDSLEIFERRGVHGDDEHTLVDVIDETACALGSRKLTDWLRRPLLEPDVIEARLDAVEELTETVQTREELHDHLRDVYDLERLISRVSRGRANARDLRSLKATLDVVPAVRDAMADVDCAKLEDLRAGLDDLADVRDLIDRAIREEPAIEITEGQVITPAYHDELAALRETEREGKDWIDDLEESERERTGIESLKVGHNAVHGYYIEVTDPNLDAVPDDYTRRQTLKNAERFYTPELKQREDEILRAEQQADDLEHELFLEVRREVAAESARVQAVAEVLAELDVLAGLAAVAAKHDYCRPTFDGDGIHVRKGRHPVVERTEESFVPNDVRLDDEEPFAVITGPNMSGKSTYMRQVALIVVLAQVGSFVPAADASLDLVDRVYTRVGASDDIAGGRSTFMVEMTEVADILAGATEDSLVLLDEVGRGTSTADGLAIARAVTEYVHDEVGARTLFATHHHELTATAADLEGAFNLHFAATQRTDGVAFQHDVERGAATGSYGVEVARAAGLPDEVVSRARDLLHAEGASEGAAGDQPDAVEGDAATGHTTPDTETDDDAAAGDVADTPRTTTPTPTSTDGDADPGTHDALVAELEAIDLAATTPLEAMNRLARLKELLEDERGE